MKKEAYSIETLRHWLSGRLHTDDLHELAYLAQGTDDKPVKQSLYRLLFDEDRRVAENAAWVFNYFDLHSNCWLYDKHHELIDEVLRTDSDTKRRLLLGLLLRQSFHEADFRTDFLDFCLYRMVSVAEPTAVRAQCIKLAYVQCLLFPELFTELRTMLEIMEPDLLPPALRATRKNILNRIITKLKQ